MNQSSNICEQSFLTFCFQTIYYLKYFSIIFPVEIESQGIYLSLERAQDLKDKQDCGGKKAYKNVSIVQ